MNKTNQNDSSSSSNLAKVITLIAISIIVIATYFFLNSPEVSKRKYEEVHADSAEKDTVSIGGDFELINYDGQLESTTIYKGTPRLVYFGFTYCPDVCPVALSNLGNVISTLNKYKFNIIPMFVTIDPERDKPEVIKSFATHYSSNFRAYTGSYEQIKNVADQYKVYFAKANDGREGDDYLVDHSSFIYLLDGDAKYIKHFSSDTPADEIVNYIRINLMQNKR